MKKKIICAVVFVLTLALIIVLLVCLNNESKTVAESAPDDSIDLSGGEDEAVLGNGPNDIKYSGATDEELIEYVRASVVMVTAGEKHASGVIISIDDEKVVMLTAGHLMQGFEQGIITFSTGNAGFGDVVYISDNPDLCVLSFKTEYIDENLLNQLRKSVVDIKCYEDLKEGSEVFLCGSAVNTGSNATKGTVASKQFYVDDYDSWMLYLYADVMPGMSGCPVYDSAAHLIGILCAGNESGEAVAISLPDIAYILEEIDYDKN